MIKPNPKLDEQWTRKKGDVKMVLKFTEKELTELAEDLSEAEKCVWNHDSKCLKYYNHLIKLFEKGLNDYE